MAESHGGMMTNQPVMTTVNKASRPFGNFDKCPNSSPKIHTPGTGCLSLLVYHSSSYPCLATRFHFQWFRLSFGDYFKIFADFGC